MNQRQLELIILSTFLISLFLFSLTFAYLNERRNRIDEKKIKIISGSTKGPDNENINVTQKPHSDNKEDDLLIPEWLFYETQNQEKTYEANGTSGKHIRENTDKSNNQTSAIMPQYHNFSLRFVNSILYENLNFIRNLLNITIPRSLLKQNTRLKFPIVIEDPNNLLKNKQQTEQQKPLAITYTPELTIKNIPNSPENTFNQIQPLNSSTKSTDLIGETKEVIIKKLANKEELLLNTTYDAGNGLQFRVEQKRDFKNNHNFYILVIFESKSYTSGTKFSLSGVKIQEEKRTEYNGRQHNSIQIESIKSISEHPLNSKDNSKK